MRKIIFLSLMTFCTIFSEIIGGLSEEEIRTSPNIHVRNKRLIDRTLKRPYPANLRDFPSMVSVQKNYFHSCGGNILSPYIVLTAAHCMMDAYATYTVLSNTENLHRGIRHNVIRYLTHPKYSNTSLRHDLAMLTILPPIDLVHSRNREIALYDHDVYPHTYGFLLGWGCTNVHDKFTNSNYLVSVTVPTISKEECRAACSNYGVITNKEICTLDRSGRTCSGLGDSGGPLIVNDKLLGVLSWSPGMADGVSPDVFSNMAHPAYRNWVLAYLRHIEITSKPHRRHPH